MRFFRRGEVRVPEDVELAGQAQAYQAYARECRERREHGGAWVLRDDAPSPWRSGEYPVDGLGSPESQAELRLWRLGHTATTDQYAQMGPDEWTALQEAIDARWRALGVNPQTLTMIQ